MLQIIDKRKYTYIFSAFLLSVSILMIAVWGLKFGIDFTGGTLMEVEFSTPKDRTEIETVLGSANLESLSVQTSDNNRALIRYIGSDESVNENVAKALRTIDEGTKQLRVDFIGATISDQLKGSARTALIFAIIGILFYIAWAFRKVSFPVSSWLYGGGAVAALFHDVIITLGVFAFLGKFYGVEVGIPFIAALLTILGYSVNDTIVIYDRIRENILRSRNIQNFEETINNALNESLARSINTSVTVLVVLVAIMLFGGTTLTWFAVALFIGVLFGTYSSIYVATAILVSVYKYKSNTKGKEQTTK